MAPPDGIHKYNFIFNLQTNSDAFTLWFFPQTKKQQLHTQYTSNEWKGCKSSNDNPQHLHSAWSLKKFIQVYQLCLLKKQQIWNKTKHSTILLYGSKRAASYWHLRNGKLVTCTSEVPTITPKNTCTIHMLRSNSVSEYCQNWHLTNVLPSHNVASLHSTKTLPKQRWHTFPRSGPQRNKR